MCSLVQHYHQAVSFCCLRSLKGMHRNVLQCVDSANQNRRVCYDLTQCLCVCVCVCVSVLFMMAGAVLQEKRFCYDLTQCLCVSVVFIMARAVFQERRFCYNLKQCLRVCLWCLWWQGQRLEDWWVLLSASQRYRMLWYRWDWLLEYFMCPQMMIPDALMQVTMIARILCVSKSDDTHR